MEEKVRQTDSRVEGKAKTTALSCSPKMPLPCPGCSAYCSQHQALPRKVIWRCKQDLVLS